MPNPYFKFKQFTIHHDRCAMKVTTDACFFGAWCAQEIANTGLLHPKLLDIGAGSGLLSLMIAQKNAVAIDAVEIDKDAAEQAKENIAASPWQQRTHVFNEDILRFNPAGKYDLIISNPPFYENELSSDRQQRNIAHHSKELKMADVIRVMHDRLEAQGMFFLLYPFKRQEEIAALLGAYKFHIYKKIILQPSAQHAPSRVMVMGSKTEGGRLFHTTVSIYNEQKEYTAAFVEVLKDYYLYL
jgi:tRNA1Val (adenine37-N6)-methyltransferase